MRTRYGRFALHGGQRIELREQPQNEVVGMALGSKWKPTFIGIGAQKSATTWCWAALRQHPEICMAQPKELEYFSENYHRGRHWYAQHFRAPKLPVQGEISPLYMDNPQVARRIAEVVPEATIVAVLRNPFQRAVSNLLHTLSGIDGRIAVATARRARQLVQRTEQFVRRSCYADALEPYFEMFPKKQIKILFFEQIAQDRAAFLRNLYGAVGADLQFMPTHADRVVNKSMDFASPLLFRILQTASQSFKSWLPTRRGMEWLYRRTSMREWALQNLVVDRGRPTWEFTDLFGSDAVDRIASDLERLRLLLHVDVPIAWMEDPALIDPSREVA
ncbi:MAG: sulfotransferase [Planctomycetota bacterium]